MTVGVAALTENGQAIVVMTDKRITIGDYDLTTEQTFAKLFETANGWFAAYAGNATFAESVIAFGHGTWDALSPDKRPTYQIGMLEHFHRAYLDKYEDAVERNVLRPRLYDRDFWRDKSITSDFDAGLRDELTAAFTDFDDDQGADLLLFGFDPRLEGHILSVGLEHQIHEQEWAAIGSGGAIAEGRLAWQKTRRDRGMARTLYEVYEAAVHASMNPAVGVNLIAAVMWKNGRDGIEPVPTGIMRLLDEVFRFNDHSPFMTTNVVGTDEPLIPPHPKWETTVREWVEGVMGRRSEWIARATLPSSPNAPEQPSAQSKNASRKKDSQPSPSRPSTRQADRVRRRQGSSRRSQPRRSAQP